MRLLLIINLLLLFLNESNAQRDISKSMSFNSVANATANLFIHADKNIYTNNETIWFTGYLIRKNISEINKHKIISIALIRDIDTTVVIEEKFKMQYGIAFGSIVLPDSIEAGDYHLFAFTDRLVNNMPEATFSQSIIIKTNVEPPIKASMVLSKSVDSAKHHQVLISVTSKDNQLLPKPTIINYSYGSLTKTINTNFLGQALLKIPKQTYPAQYLNVKLRNHKDSTFLTMPLPQVNSKASVKFYPEGGNLIAGLPANIGWEVKDELMKPLTLKALLYKNETIIDTIETSSYGIGKFNLPVEAGMNYSVKLLNKNLTDSTYQLPTILDEGINLTIIDAVATDSLRMTLRSNGVKSLKAHIHNFRESFLHLSIDMPYSMRSIKIPLDQIPKGLCTVTISDSLDRPLAERMFFAHYDASEKLAINTNQAVYEKRKKVGIELKLKDPKEEALVSIACVQNNRIDTKKMTDIESYTFLNNEIASLPINMGGRAYIDKQYIEQILLVKGWTKYSWQEIQHANEKRKVAKIDSLQIIGQLLDSKKTPSKEITLGIMRNQGIDLFTTNNNGSFNLNDQKLMSEMGRKTFIFSKNKIPYILKVDDPFTKLNNQLKKSVLNENRSNPSNLLNNNELILRNNEKAIKLKEVVIKYSNDSTLYYASKKLRGPNACGDFVCSFNILNCPNHIGALDNTQPIAGETYLAESGSLKKVLYSGCILWAKTGNELFIPVKGLLLQKEFYHNEYKSLDEPALSSTLYWNYSTLIKAGETKKIDFYTSDITGTFRIIVQGITKNDVIYAENKFEVKQKGQAN